ncbi:hypothetical protein A6R70_09035 [Agrobacterium rubi]|nr:hypothetical protein [Agrobacterium rubi]
MGKSHWTPRHSKRLIDVFAAGILIFMGIQASAGATPILKPHRLECAQRSQNSTSSTTDTATMRRDGGALWMPWEQSRNHDFVHSFLSFAALVSDYTKAQIGTEDMQSNTHGFRLTGTVSPRGPPRIRS